jgi:hypothetical protein
MTKRGGKNAVTDETHPYHNQLGEGALRLSPDFVPSFYRYSTLNASIGLTESGLYSSSLKILTLISFATVRSVKPLARILSTKGRSILKMLI